MYIKNIMNTNKIKQTHNKMGNDNNTEHIEQTNKHIKKQ